MLSLRTCTRNISGFLELISNSKGGCARSRRQHEHDQPNFLYLFQLTRESIVEVFYRCKYLEGYFQAYIPTCLTSRCRNTSPSANARAWSGVCLPICPSDHAHADLMWSSGSATSAFNKEVADGRPVVGKMVMSRTQSEGSPPLRRQFDSPRGHPETARLMGFYRNCMPGRTANVVALLPGDGAWMSRGERMC